MKVLVTGAGGFLGKHLVCKLLLRGYQVTNFSRKSHKHLEKLGVNQIQGDLTSEESVSNALKDHDAVFHVASLVGMWGDYDDFHKTNVIGTRNIINGCKLNGISNLIYTSTPSVVFGEDDLQGVDESIPYPQNFLCHYAKTKSIAEKEVLAANSEDLKTVAIRPHLIFGEDDPHMIPRIVEKARHGKLKQVGDGRNMVDVIYVKNAADAHLKALDGLVENTSICGKAYFIGQDEPVNLWDFVNNILKENDIPPIKKSISEKNARRIGSILETVYKAFKIKKEPPMTRFIALQLSKSHYFNHSGAKEELNFTPSIDLPQALRETFHRGL